MAKQNSKPVQKEVPRQKPKAKPAPQGPSFLTFLLDREQQLDWAIIGGLFIAILIFLKIYYPYPQTETDSGNYILSAATGKINGYRPYGYSGFMSFFHGFSADVKFVLTWQWLITFFSVSFFLFTIKFIFSDLPKVAFYVLCLICILNPSVIFMDAYMMSDSLFVSLTLLFLTTCIWIIYSGSWVAMISNLLLLWWCMDTRYIGLFYPVFTIAALFYQFWKKYHVLVLTRFGLIGILFFLYKQRDIISNKPLSLAFLLRFRLHAFVAISLPIFMLYVYRISTAQMMEEEFGVKTFSAFGGWQKANNGVAVLPYVKVDPNEITDPQVKAIHQIVRQFPDSVFKTADIIATSFMWTKNYPGKQCLVQYIQQTGTPYLKAWAYMGTQMDAYGDFLQSHYRVEFFKHYIIPNFINVFRVYDIGEYKEFNADANMKTFFTTDRDSYHYKKEFFRPLTSIRQICDSLAWVLLILSSLAGLIMIKKLNWSLEQKLIVTALVLFIGAFCGASTIAAPINNFRYMMPILYAQLVVPVLLISGIVAGLKKEK